MSTTTAITATTLAAADFESQTFVSAFSNVRHSTQCWELEEKLLFRLEH